MKLVKLLFIFFLVFQFITAQKKEISLSDIFEKGVFRTRGIGDFDFRKDGKTYSRLNGNKIVRYDIVSGQELEVLFDAEKQAMELMNKLSSYTFSSDEQNILLTINVESIYRYSSVAETYVYNLKLMKLIRVFPEGKVMYPHFNPVGDKIAFVYKNNLYYQNLLTNTIQQITKNGEKNKIINGASDWVYEEEFTLLRAYEWSSNGDQIAFISFDESKVKEFSIDYYRDSAYPEKYSFKYPKVGEENSKLTVWNYNLKKKKSKLLNTGIGLTDDIYIPRIQWTNSNEELCVTWLNRQQNKLRLILVNTKKNSSRILFEENNKYYIDLHDNLVFTRDGKNFLWTSEMNGTNQLYCYDMNGKLERQITSGDLELTEFYGMNEDESILYFQRAENRGLERKIYSITRNGEKLTCLSLNEGVNQAKMSIGAKYFIISNSSINSVPTHNVCNNSGKVIRLLEDNKDLRKRLDNFSYSPVELGSIKNSHGDELNSFMIKPLNFDSTKKYPVFMFLYGGPGSQQVMNRWTSISSYWWHQMIAQKGYLICVVDNRGTGGRGEFFKKMTYKQLGKYETEDQIDVAKYLSGLPYVDGSRIGIFGWSYGAYMSTLCLLKGNDVFKSAIAVAPVTNWKWYDSIYTERYMGDENNNKASYQENSPVYFADRLKGNYLLVHGLADDNVHFQNTAEMTKELIKNKKQFDTYVYPNRNHGISGDNASMHLFTKMTNFVLEKI
ncbi:MAG: S9 family peptidase [Saprospiraceae bacterium]